MESGRWFFRVIESADGWWACRRGRAEVDRHAEIDEALRHIRQIAAENRPSQVWVHHLDGRVVLAADLG
ncbi:MAG TPA: DUF2188 domain-containing protein [Acidimicrobiales bacterium]|nr:DUF2188 domain-containing protein [Acidimicrobiales bacterium]